MKYLSIFLLVLLSTGSVKAQKIDSAAIARLGPDAKEKVNHYLVQAKKAKTTGLIMCFAGGALMIAGGVMGIQAIKNDNEDPDPWDYNNPSTTVVGDNSLSDAGAVLFWVGTASALASIPFFIKSHKKADAARAMVFAGENVSLAPNIVMPGTRSAGIRLLIPVGR